VSARQTLFQRPTSKTLDGVFYAVSGLMDTLDRLRQAEQDEDEVDLSAINAAIAAANGQIADLIAALNEIDLNGALTAQQEFELALVTQVDTILGSVSQAVKDSIRRSEESAASVIRGLLRGKKNEVAIRVEQAARLTDREAFVSQNTEFSAQIDLALGRITEETQARADGDNALSSVDQQITTALNGNIAQVEILAESINGIEQKFAVTLNSNGQVTGLIQLDGSPAGSNFTIVADKLLVAQPGVSGGSPVPVFAIQNVGGATTKLALRGDMYADGSIIARMVAAAAITADKIAANSINAAKIAAGAVTEIALGTNAVTAAKILDGSIVTNKLGALAVTAAKIAANAITADKISAGAVTAAKIAVTSLSALSANLGTVTAGLIQNGAGTLKFDLPNMRLYRTDGKMDIDLKNLRLRIGSG
jgi:hypothetical protein